MGTTTRKQAYAPRKRIPSEKARKNEQKSPVVAKKHVKASKPKKFIHPDDISKETSPVAVSESLTPPPELELPEDVSEVEFTLAKSVVLGSESIYSDTLIATLADFNYRAFDVEAMRRADKRVTESGYTFKWQSGSAILSYKGLLKANVFIVEVSEPYDWDKAKRLIERWMRDYKRDITVKLTIIYKKIGENAEQSLNNDINMEKGERKVYSKSSIIANFRPAPAWRWPHLKLSKLSMASIVRTL